MQSSLVYQFSCVNCTFGYVGCSRRTLATRVAEHAGKSSRTGRALTTPPHSSVRERTRRNMRFSSNNESIKNS